MERVPGECSAKGRQRFLKGHSTTRKRSPTPRKTFASRRRRMECFTPLSWPGRRTESCSFTRWQRERSAKRVCNPSKCLVQTLRFRSSRVLKGCASVCRRRRLGSMRTFSASTSFPRNRKRSGICQSVWLRESSATARWFLVRL